MIRQPLPTRAGKAVALVWKPIEKAMADSLPTNLATRSSSSICKSEVPAMARDEASEIPCFLTVSSTESAQGPWD